MPSLPDAVEPRQIQDLAHRFASAISAKGGTRKSGNGVYEMEVNSLHYAIESADLADQVREGDELRPAVEVVATFSGLFAPHKVAEFAEAAASALRGDFAPGVGRITVIKVTPGDWKNLGSLRRFATTIAVRLDAVARVAG